jgi:hypothetical protein
MIAWPMGENLRLTSQPPEGARVNDARPIALERRPVGMRWFRICACRDCIKVVALDRIGRERSAKGRS